MSIKKLIEFATTGDKNTDELDLERGFPSRIYPARQWFNWLFNSLTVKINEIIENKVDKSDLSEISQDEADQGTNTVSKLISANVLKSAISQHVPINNTLTSASTSQALSAAQGKYIYDRMFGIDQTWKDVTSKRVRGTTYTNTTPKPIQVGINANVNNGFIDLGGVVIPWDDSAYYTTFFFIVPPDTTYSVNPASDGTIYVWAELS